MTIDVRRTFSKFSEAETDDDSQDWSRVFGIRRRGTSWSDLHQKPLVVVVGEAGIGKTVEFQTEVERLRSRGHSAFFAPLNQLSDLGSWDLVMADQVVQLQAWCTSDEIGHFFLDAVDEARLKSHADFEKALSVVHLALSTHLSRVHVCLSSRVTDWSLPSVRKAVERRLATPLTGARAASEVSRAATESAVSEVVASPVGSLVPIEPYVVSLDPLSESEAKRCAEAYGVHDPTQFWAAVEEGDYAFMATRPLDLHWMVALWNERKTLGTYRELIEANVTNRLREFNESYQTEGEALSVSDLHEAAVELAAAAEFGGVDFFSVDPCPVVAKDELDPYAILHDHGPPAVRRLLATAIFDEASLGRVKFHHRSTREFMAAEWVREQLVAGLPLHRVHPLFARSPYGECIPIPVRRPVLSWLSALSVAAREWVVRDFPELLLYEGDPEAWDKPSVEMALENLIARTKQRRAIDWILSPSEFARVGKVLDARKVADALADTDLPPEMKSKLLAIARHAKLSDCADVCFAMYNNATAPSWERVQALDALEFVATADHRQSILSDIKAGRLNSNELVARALPATDWKSLTAAELAGIFDHTRDESEYGSGSMARALNDDLLPYADLTSAARLLEAVMCSLPRPAAGKRFARFPDSERPPRAWLLSVLPNGFARVLELLGGATTEYPSVCLEAAERIEALRDSGFVDNEKFEEIHRAIAEHPRLRWSVALAIAESEDLRASVGRLTWDTHCLVRFTVVDLEELTKRALDSEIRSDEREIWFAVAVSVTFSIRDRRTRVQALRALAVDHASKAQRTLVKENYERLRNANKYHRESAARRHARGLDEARNVAAYKASLIADLALIRSGRDVNLLQRLLRFAVDLSGRRDYSDVDFEATANSLGEDAATAFKDGLQAYWPTLQPPAPSDYPDGSVPWVALIALAGVRASLHDDHAIELLSPSNVQRVAQLAVWELDGPPAWFASVARMHSLQVSSALSTWIVDEAQSSTTASRRTLRIALRSAPDLRRTLLTPLLPLVTAGEVTDRDVYRELVKAMREDDLLSLPAIDMLCQSNVAASIGPNERIRDLGWLRFWLECNPSAAWSWFIAHVNLMASDGQAEMAAFASSASDLTWLQLPLVERSARLLVDIHRAFSAYPALTSAPATNDEDDFFGSPSKRLRDAIPNVLVGVRGQIGRDALLSLLSTLTDPDERKWLAGRLAEHAALDAALDSSWGVEDLRRIGSPFLDEPRTEAHLFQQVIARLEDIRVNLEEGPFSERVLFARGIREKFVQLWLASKFRDTQNRRFSVHREEEVDDDNRTDVQLSCAAGNVCVEIKPLDSSRSYSATSLTQTLREQIVGQYLRGTNSASGILVLIQLDHKTWDIPGEGVGRPFAALVAYLQKQADSIKRDAHVDELVVLGIRCVA